LKIKVLILLKIIFVTGLFVLLVIIWYTTALGWNFYDYFNFHNYTRGFYSEQHQYFILYSGEDLLGYIHLIATGISTLFLGFSYSILHTAFFFSFILFILIFFFMVIKKRKLIYFVFIFSIVFHSVNSILYQPSAFERWDTILISFIALCILFINDFIEFLKRKNKIWQINFLFHKFHVKYKYIYFTLTIVFSLSIIPYAYFLLKLQAPNIYRWQSPDKFYIIINANLGENDTLISHIAKEDARVRNAVIMGDYFFFEKCTFLEMQDSTDLDMLKTQIINDIGNGNYYYITNKTILHVYNDWKDNFTYSLMYSDEHNVFNYYYISMI